VRVVQDASAGERRGEPSVSHLIDRRGWCRLAYEPVADLARGVICGYEAVARFPAAMQPEQWRAEALRRGLEPDLDAFVVGSVLQARESLPGDSFLSFDIRSQTLLRAPVCELLTGGGRLDNLVVELTPRAPAGSEAALAQLVARLRGLGATIAIDGLGAGYATLRHVATVRPEFVKVDAALVRGVDRDDAKVALLETLGQLASRLDAWIVALGVETIEELDALMRLRIPLAQGPLVGVRAKTLTNVGFPLASYVRERGIGATQPGALMPLLERPEPLERGSEPDAIAAALPAAGELRHVVLVDERRRPVALHERASFLRGEPPAEDVLLVTPAAEPAEVARRAMLRPPATRFHPVVVCDVRGRYVGVVRIERLVALLAA
jgi:EAL domain-containing protein (putative c-di-GMP-specific phosphodiesterase class I)